MTNSTQASDTIKSFTARNQDAEPLQETFPSAALLALADEEDLPATLAPSLLSMLSLAARYEEHIDSKGRNRTAGQAFSRRAQVARAMSKLQSPSAELSVALAEVLRGCQPAADKPERDRSIEGAEDDLALACVEALARHGRATAKDTIALLQETSKHRDRKVRSLSQDVLRMLEYLVG